ncbi:tetratricopeptide repeat protein [Malaciobacter marinus]|uniref:Tetratricopeptide repeat protein n=1 Tax=Malaciobacter marinus TaxID=505249 RepID=A0A347TIW9_9BACT|nr:tetratricopeptide repeat protein [Malaciobacter marinus]AXX86547.1 tetratricopeptide repeat protein [Malaciobacter marinus]PHO16390.1 hypothetical protein CPH92_01595 [Malaciobacter marinus]
MKIKNNILKIVLVNLLALGFIACDDNKSSTNIKSEKKVKLPKPEWDTRLANVEQNTGKWYQLADNDEIAARNIAIIYRDELKNYKKAIKWYLYANSININADNLFGLALTYDDLKDYDNAIKYYKESFNLKYKEETINNLSLLYKKNLKDYKNAAIWYKKGIKRESIYSIKGMANLYHNNLKDDVKASAYLLNLIAYKEFEKEKTLKYLKEKWKLSNETIKKGYELQLTMPGLPKRYKGKLGLDE